MPVAADQEGRFLLILGPKKIVDFETLESEIREWCGADASLARHLLPSISADYL